MIYTYEDIVKKTEESITFSEINTDDVGKIITILLYDNGCYTSVSGGRITGITEEEIMFDKELITDSGRVYTADSIKASYFVTHQCSKVRIYEPVDGKEYAYFGDEFVNKNEAKVIFNQDILKPGSRFFMTVNGKCGIVEVESVCETIVSFEEICTLRGGSRLIYSSNSETLKSITLKPIKELTNYDLLLRDFTGYKIRPSLLIKLQALLGDTKAIPDEDFEKE